MSLSNTDIIGLIIGTVLGSIVIVALLIMFNRLCPVTLTKTTNRLTISPLLSESIDDKNDVTDHSTKYSVFLPDRENQRRSTSMLQREQSDWFENPSRYSSEQRSPVAKLESLSLEHSFSESLSTIHGAGSPHSVRFDSSFMKKIESFRPKSLPKSLRGTKQAVIIEVVILTIYVLQLTRSY